MEKIIKEFWYCSIRKDFSTFDFDVAFEEFLSPLHLKLTQHGLTTLEEFVEERKSFQCNLTDFSEYVWDTDYLYVSSDDLEEALFAYLFKRARDTFKDMFSDLIRLEKRINNRGTNADRLALLFDECIHAEHQTGMILEDIDIEGLREEVERTLK